MIAGRGNNGMEVWLLDKWSCFDPEEEGLGLFKVLKHIKLPGKLNGASTTCWTDSDGVDIAVFFEAPNEKVAML